MVSIISLTSEQDRAAANQIPVKPHDVDDDDEAADKVDSGSSEYEATGLDYLVLQSSLSGDDDDEDESTALARSLSDICSVEDAASSISSASYQYSA